MAGIFTLFRITNAWPEIPTTPQDHYAVVDAHAEAEAADARKSFEQEEALEDQDEIDRLAAKEQEEFDKEEAYRHNVRNISSGKGVDAPMPHDSWDENMEDLYGQLNW